MKKIILLLCLITIIISCEVSISNFGNYHLDGDSALENVLVLDKSGSISFVDELGIKRKGILIKTIDSNEIADSFYATNGWIVLSNYIDSFAIDSYKFILIARKPIIPIERKVDSIIKNSSNNYSSYNLILDELKTSTHIEYFIINQIDDIIYGPYNRERFFLQRKKFKIPVNLNLTKTSGY